jgi:hypothetical protein
MPLLSKLFKGDERLEACLIKDSAHLTPGTKGPFVNKVQRALAQLDGDIVTQAEVDSQTYGPSTASAVLNFKRRNNIVNRTYQTQADNIVGKMTIAFLDARLAKLDTSGGRRCDCGDPVGTAHRPLQKASLNFSIAADTASVTGAGSGAGPSPVAARTNLNLPTHVLRMSWQITKLADQANGRQHDDMVQSCDDLLDDDTMILTVGGPLTNAPAFDYPYLINTSVRADNFGLLLAARKAKPLFNDTIRVIVHVFESNSQEFGFTDGGEYDGVTYNPFIVINAAKRRTDRLTLLHEMVHATGLLVHDDDRQSPGSFPDKTSVFSINDKRDHIRPEHLARLKKMTWFRDSPL